MALKDNLANSYYQPDNILYISRFEGQVDDRVLYDLMPFLKNQHSLSNLRKVDNRYVAYLEELEQKQKNERQAANIRSKKAAAKKP